MPLGGWIHGLRTIGLGPCDPTATRRALSIRDSRIENIALRIHTSPVLGAQPSKKFLADFPYPLSKAHLHQFRINSSNSMYVTELLKLLTYLISKKVAAHVRRDKHMGMVLVLL